MARVAVHPGVGACREVVDAPLEILEGDVNGAFDMAGFPLVVLADVEDHRRAPGPELVGELGEV